MVNAVNSGAQVQFQPGNYARESSGGSSKVKLDISSVPESKVKIQTSANVGSGKGLRLDIKV